MRRASAKRTRSRAAGPSVGRVLLRRTTRGRRRPIFSAPSAPPKGKALGLSCPPATARPWLCSQGNLDCSRPRRTCHPSPRSGGMACFDEAARTKQHHALAVAAEITRAQPRRKHLAIYARQLALKPHLQILRRHFGPLLFCLEQTHRHALENNVHRHARLGSSVIISETRY